LSELRVDVGPPRRQGRRRAWPRTLVRSSSWVGGNLSVAGFYRVRGVRLVVGSTTKHSRVGS
jgi:hypothetical protein